MNDLKHGEGKQENASGHIYEGSWKKNMRHGYGELTDGDLNEVYTGHWRKDKRHGQGKQ